MRTYQVLLIVAVTAVSFIFFSNCTPPQEEKITIIIKIKDEVQIVGGSTSQLNPVNFPTAYFKTQASIKNTYISPTTQLNLNVDNSFIKAITNPSLSESKYPLIPFVSSTIIKIDSIVPLFSNYDDVLYVMNEAARNNNQGKYMFTNLFNYVKIELRVNKTGKKIIEKVLQSFLFKSNPNFLNNILKKQEIIEYFYYPGVISPATTTTTVSTSSTSGTYKDVLGITTLCKRTPSVWGTGSGINIIDFDEGVSTPVAPKWSFTELPINPSTHGDQVMSVLFGGACDTIPLTGLVPQATAEVVSYTDYTLTGQYSQFLHALRKSLVADASIGRVKSRILLIEVHNQVAVNNRDILPVESDPAMFFLIRLGSFGLKLIIVEAAGNGKISLDSLPKTYFDSTFRGTPLGEFSSLIARSRSSSNIEATPLQIDNTTATTEEIDSNRIFNYNLITGATIRSWLTTWRSSPSGAILIAGYGPSTSKCNTNYGSKVKIIGPGNNVESLKFDGTTPCKIEPFNKSSAASVVITGIIASALSKDTSLTEAQIKNALYNHTTLYTVTIPAGRTTPAYNMKVPNVSNFYNSLGLSRTAP